MTITIRGKCRRCDSLTENGRCPACFELDEKARRMFVDLERIYQEHEQLWQRLAEYDENE